MQLSRRVSTFAHQHDDLAAFHAAYLVGTFFGAAVLNLGFFACLIAMHMCLDVFKFRDVHGFSWPNTIRAVILESLLDVTLFFVALASSIYLHHTYGLEAVSGITRSRISIAAIFAIVIPKMEILNHSLNVYLHLHRYLHDEDLHIRRRLTFIQSGCIALTLAAIVLLVLTPFFFAHSETQLVHILEEQLIPWNF